MRRGARNPAAAAALLRELAELRYQLRRFLLFSEEASGQRGLPPQQHQLLLQIAGAVEGVETTVSYVAERMGLRHHSVVELSQRCEEARLIERKHDSGDHRRVLLRVTAEGERVLRALSEDHARELHQMAPRMVRALTRIGDLGREIASVDGTEGEMRGTSK